MSGLLNWVGNILFFLVFVTVIENLLPGKEYRRYVRLSAGMVVILLVLSPVTGGLHLEGQIRQWFETFAFQQEAHDLSRDIMGMERQRLARVIDGYEEMVEEDVKSMAAEMGARAVSAQVTMEKDEESEHYGAVTHIRLEVEWEGGNQRVEERGRGTDGGSGEEDGSGEEGRDGENDRAVQAVNPVSPVDKVTVEVDSPDGGEKDNAGEVKDGEDKGTDPERERDPGEISKYDQYDQVEQLRRKVERYYGLETGEVEIEFKGR